MKNKNILLISENKKAKEFFSKKLLLLRNSDDIEVSNIERIENYDIKFTPNVIILDLAGKEDVAESEIRFCKDSFKDVYLIIFSEISTPVSSILVITISCFKYSLILYLVSTKE